MVADDGELVGAYLQGDSGAFAQIYDRYGDRIYDFCRSMLRNDADAADAAQDTFVLASQRLGQLRDPERLRAWLYAIARNQAMRTSGKRARVAPVEDLTMIPATGSAVDTGLAADEVRELVWSGAEGLNERDRSILELNVRHGLEGQELADAIGTSSSHAYVLLFRVREQIERSVGALLVARHGRSDCEELGEILRGWDGRFSPLLRKRVVRHVEACETCGERRRTLVSPLAAYGAVPFLAAPAIVREHVLAPSARPTSGARSIRSGADGFPAPSALSARRALVASISAAAVAVVIIALLVSHSSSPRSLQAGSTRLPDGTETPTGSGSSGAPQTTTRGDPASTGSNGSSSSSSNASTASNGPTNPTPAGLVLSTRGLDFGSSATQLPMTILNKGQSALSWSASSSDLWFSVTPTSGTLQPGAQQQVTVALDRAAAPEKSLAGLVTVTAGGDHATVTLAALVDRPPVISGEAARSNSLAAADCASPSLPERTDVDVSVSDGSGIPSVQLHWSSPGDGNGSAQMAPNDSGNDYVGSLGPFKGDQTVEWWVTASDPGGHVVESAHHAITVAHSCLF
ncbi:MAG: hypothetical protein QOI95_1102 [Acidimicrobiaceae bacterium]